MSTGVLQLQASLVQARDAQVTRVVAMVDALPDRGEADALIAPLRPRLAQLRPARPPGFTRLLFTPLNPVIMPLPDWRRCGLGVPRPALSLLGAAIQAALPDCAALPVDQDERAVAVQLLCPDAAAVLDRLDLPPDWHDATGLAMRDFPVVARAAASVLHEAAAIERLARKRDRVDNGEIWPILSRSKARGPVALDTVVSVLLARLHVPAQVAVLAIQASEGDRATGQAIDRLASSLSIGEDGADLREAAMEANRVAALLDALEESATADRRAQLDQVRRDADALARRSFDQAVTQAVAMARSAISASFDDGAITTMEAFARDLRRFETAARKLGSGDLYDASLAAASVAMQDLEGDLGLADRVRLVEILAGPEQALALLKAGT